MKLTLVMILGFLLISIAGSPADGAVYYVKDTGNDAASGLSDEEAWKTIARINRHSFSAGDTVCLKRGSRFADATLSSPNVDDFTFSDYGEGEKPHLDGRAIRPVYISPPRTISNLTIRNIDISGQDWTYNKELNMHIINVNNLVLDGIQGDGHKNGNSSDGKNAVTVQRCMGRIQIMNCVLSNWGPNDLPKPGRDYMGIVLLNINEGEYSIHDNMINNVNADGIHICDCTAPGIVTKNTISNCGEDGIDIKGTSNCTIINNEFFRTEAFVDRGGSGWAAYSTFIVVHEGYANSISSNIVIRSNQFRHGNVNAVRIASANATEIAHNYIFNTNGAVCIANISTNTLVHNNTIINPRYTPGYHSQSTGDVVDGGAIHEHNTGTGTKIHHNTIVNTSGSARHLISFACSNGAEVTRNVVYHANPDSQAYCLFRYPCGSLGVVDRNCWFNANSSNRIKDGRTVYPVNTLADWLVAHPGDQFGDPLLIDAGSGKYQPSPSSSCRDEGGKWGASVLPPGSMRLFPSGS